MPGSKKNEKATNPINKINADDGSIGDEVYLLKNIPKTKPETKLILNLILSPNSFFILNPIKKATMHIRAPIKYKKYSVWADNKKSIRFDASNTLRNIEIKKGRIKSRKNTSLSFLGFNVRFDNFKLAKNNINLS